MTPPNNHGVALSAIDRDYDREYNPPSFKGECPNCKRLENENRRMLIALESIQRMAGDMLNAERRTGPRGGQCDDN